MLPKNKKKYKTKDIFNEIKSLVKNYFKKEEKTKAEQEKKSKVTKPKSRVTKIKSKSAKIVKPNKAKQKIKIKLSKTKTVKKSTLERRKKFRNIAPEELTGISSQNIGETQHAESPQTSLYVHIPSTTPAANVTGSNALSSLSAQKVKNYNKPISIQELYKLSDNNSKKQAVLKSSDEAKNNKSDIFTNIVEKILIKTKKEKNFARAEINEKLDNMDRNAITVGGTLGSMSNRHGKREKK